MAEQKKTWLTEIGGVCLTLAGVCTAVSQVIPPTHPYTGRLIGVAAILGAVGIALVGSRISKKSGSSA